MARRSRIPPESATVLDGKFRLVETLASGEETALFLAEHTGIQRSVELKLLGPDMPFMGPAASRLVREARAMGAVSHAGVQSVVDSGTDPEGRPYVVYEALRGTSLADVLAESAEGLDPVRVGRIALSTIEALRALHRAGIVVRGLGPENVVVLPARDDDEPIKLRSLESAAFLADPPPREPVPRTPWVAPEIVRGDAGLDPRADVYSVGVMMRHLLTGDPEPRTALSSALPDVARRAIDRAAAPSPDDRFPDLEVLMQAVALLSPGPDVLPEPKPTMVPTDPLAADLRYLSLRRRTRHGQRTVDRGSAKVHLLPVLLTIEAIYRRLGDERWPELAALVPGVDELLPGSGNTEVHMAQGVPVELFVRIIGAADDLAGQGDLAMLTELGEAVAQRGLRRLFPQLSSPLTPEALVDAFPYVWSRITKQGAAVQLEREPRAARLAVRGQPEPSLELSGFVAGLLQAALQSTGAHDVRVMLQSCEALGDAVDVFAVSWTA